MHLANPLRRLFLTHDLPLSSVFTVVLLMPELGFLNLHPRRRVTQPKFGLIHQVLRKCNRVFLEKDNESVSNKSSILSSVHLDFWFALVVFLYNTALAESFEDLLNFRIMG